MVKQNFKHLRAKFKHESELLNFILTRCLDPFPMNPKSSTAEINIMFIGRGSDVNREINGEAEGRAVN